MHHATIRLLPFAQFNVQQARGHMKRSMLLVSEQPAMVVSEYSEMLVARSPMGRRLVADVNEYVHAAPFSCMHLPFSCISCCSCLLALSLSLSLSLRIRLKSPLNIYIEIASMVAPNSSLFSGTKVLPSETSPNQPSWSPLMVSMAWPLPPPWWRRTT